MSATSAPCAVEFKSVSKNFGEHRVLADVSFQVRKGEVVALMGENGAGKSTLMRILAGIYGAGSYDGQLFVHGVKAEFSQVRDAKKAGVAMIHQELGLFPELTVAENILLEEIQAKHPLRIRWKEVFSEAQRYLDTLGFQIDATKSISELQTGHCQLVEIARALRQDASVLIMDEPTSALTEPEVIRLFELLKTLQKHGKAIFYVSHRMEEISKVADRIVVLRDGVIAGVDSVKNLTRDQIIAWMVGRSVADIYPKRTAAKKPAHTEPILKLRDFSLRDRRKQKSVLGRINLEVFPGEIVGLGGLMGAGRSELALALYGYFGALSPQRKNFDVSGEVFFEGKHVRWNAPRQALSDKVALLTEDRKGNGLFLNRPAAENMGVTTLKSNSNALGVIRAAAETKLINKLAYDLKVRGPGLQADVGLYSGGNQQKVALAKCLALQPKLLILDEPTRGVDIGAKLEIYDIISNLTKNGVGILLISSEMPELLGLSDRVIVLRQGEVSATFAQEGGFDPEKIMHAASI